MKITAVLAYAFHCDTSIFPLFQQAGTGMLGTPALKGRLEVIIFSVVISSIVAYQ
jgi:hypothetical protein